MLTVENIVSKSIWNGHKQSIESLRSLPNLSKESISHFQSECKRLTTQYMKIDSDMVFTVQPVINCFGLAIIALIVSKSKSHFIRNTLLSSQLVTGNPNKALSALG